MGQYGLGIKVAVVEVPEYINVTVTAPGGTPREPLIAVPLSQKAQAILAQGLTHCLVGARLVQSA